MGGITKGQLERLAEKLGLEVRREQRMEILYERCVARAELLWLVTGRAPSEKLELLAVRVKAGASPAAGGAEGGAA